MERKLNAEFLHDMFVCHVCMILTFQNPRQLGLSVGHMFFVCQCVRYFSQHQQIFVYITTYGIKRREMHSLESY